MFSNPPNYRRNFRTIALAAAIILYVLIVTGGIVRVTGSGGACPDWPTCLGQWTPPTGQSASIDYLHRLATLLAVPVVLAGLVVAWRWYRNQAWIFGSMLTATGLLIAQIALGAAIARDVFPVARSWMAASHLGLSLVALGTVLLAAVMAFYVTRIEEETGVRSNNVRPGNRLVFRSPFARLSLVTLVALIFLLVSGALVAGTQSTTACPGWQACIQAISKGDLGAWISLAHRLLVPITSLLMAALFFKAWRTQRTQTPILVSTTAAVVLFFAQALLGAKLVAGFPAYLLGLHEATAVAVWAALVVQVTTVGIAARTGEDEAAEGAQVTGRKGLAKDFLMP